MDRTWWDHRTLVKGDVVVGQESDDLGFFGSEARLFWMRWRLIDDLVQRFYLDYGLEPGFGYAGVELYNVVLWSPHCRRAPRYFGRLCQHGGFHREDDSDMVREACPSISYAALTSGEPVDHADRTWSSWSDYLKEGIDALGLVRGGIEGHEGCFHRRGKSLLPLMFRVAVLLRTQGQTWKEVSPQDGRSIYSYPPRGLDAAVDEERVSFLIPPGEHPPGSHYLVSRNEEPVAAIRTDGLVATRTGELDAGRLWRAGANEHEVAAAIGERIPNG
jgi:hypothetical protein